MPQARALLEAAILLRGESPTGWELFLAAMKKYAEEANAEILRVEPGLLLRAQGMAIATAELTNLLTNAHTLVERARNAQNGQRPQASRPGPAQFS